VLYVHGSGWHWWDSTRWAPDIHSGKTNRILEDLLRLCWTEAQHDTALGSDVRASMTATGSAGVLALASTKMLAENVDADPYLLNCQNGTLDLHTLQLKPHDPADMITKITGASYTPGAAGTTWREFLESSLPDPEVRGFLQRYAGQALVGRSVEHRLVIAYGTGRNGKGTFARAVKAALGGYAVTASNDLLIIDRFGRKKSAGDLAALMVLRGARWAEMSELDKGARMDEALMKNLTGDDPITAKFMGQNYVEFLPSHSFYLAANDLPAIDADSTAAWSRIRVVPFTQSFAGREDPTLEQRIAAELDSVLTWAVEGLRAYQERGLDEPRAVLAADSEYRESNNPVGAFVAERCIVNPAASARAADLLEEYNDWARRNGEPALSAKAFGALLKTVPGVKAGKVGSARGYSGVGLAAVLEED
jgi:putative DNA primase/helicase